MSTIGLQLLLVVLIKSLLFGQVTPQCVSDCGCSDVVSCCLTVFENEDPGTIVGMVNSSEFIIETRDVANLGLTLTQSSMDDLFSISEERPGEISTLRTIDREDEVDNIMNDRYCFLLRITILNSGLEINHVLVNIKILDVNDNPPLFSAAEYVFPVMETTALNPILTCSSRITNSLTAIDSRDAVNGNVSYSVENSDVFHIVGNVGIPCATNIVSNSLDFDTPPTNYTFTLVAMDADNPSLRSRANVTYVLQDNNDNTPSFENQTYTLSIEEKLPLRTEIFRFQARDIDSGSNLVYSIIASTEVFEINQTSGSLVTVDIIDASMDSRYELVVSATDGSNTGTANVIVDVTDINEPATIELNVDREVVTQITEGEIDRSLALYTLTDNDGDDNNNNTINIISGGGGKFSIRELFPGNFLLQQIQPVDYETNKSFHIVMNSTERGNPLIMQRFTFNLTVADVNDNSPELDTSASFSFSEDDAGNQNIINLSNYVFDRDGGDNGTIDTYRLLSVRTQHGDDLTRQFMDALIVSTGILNPGFAIDREVVGNFLTFVVNITDGGTPSRSKSTPFTVTILDDNDNPPTFEMAEYTFRVMEEQETGIFIGAVVAADPDYMENGSVIYTMEPSSEFSINESTGMITGLSRFNRESRERYSLSIGAHDNGINPQTATSVTVVIIIDDINDNNPTFNVSEVTFTIPTSLQAGERIGNVMAYDLDLDPQIIYQLEPPSSSFSVPDNRSGDIFLAVPLRNKDVYTVNMSAFNPGNEERKSTIPIMIVVIQSELFIGIGVGAGILIVLIFVTIVLVLCVCHRNKKFKRHYEMEPKVDLDNQNSILKIPTTTVMSVRGRVTFKESVVETHYHDQSVINDTNNTVRKESITKFDNSPRMIHPFPDEEEEEEYDVNDGDDENDVSPDPHLMKVAVPEIEMSPRHTDLGAQGDMMNGDISVPFMYKRRPASPIVRVVNGGRDYSQGTSSDGHNYMEDEEEESSCSSDDASMVNNKISTRYGNNRPDLDIRYDTSSTHSHQLDLHQHLPPISHGQITNSSLAQLHAHNLAQLAEANRQHYNSIHMPKHENSLTPHDHNHHTSSISTHSSHSPPPPPPPSSHHTHQLMGVAASSSKHLHSSAGGRNYSHPLVMPEAFPREPTDIHFPMGSYTDYGEASTYASTELDEALGFNLDAEPGFTSLTATDYEDTEL